jgi:hypothetical protein
MRSIWGGLSLFLLVGSAQGAPLWNNRLADWSIGAYTDEQSGTFSHCAASAVYKSGISLFFSVSHNLSWRMGFASPTCQADGESPASLARTLLG